MKQTDTQLIYGLRPVMEAVKSGKGIDKIFVQSNLQGKLYLELKNMIAQSEETISVQYVPAEKLDRLTGKQNHQGVAAQLSLIEYHDI